MTEADLKKMLARNPQLSIDESPARPRQLRSALGERNSRPPLERQTPGSHSRQARPTLRYTLCRSTLLDRENLRYSTKPITDRLVEAGFITGDSEKEVIIEDPIQQLVPKSDQRVIIEIEYPDEAE
jgi:hypothetical protein